MTGDGVNDVLALKEADCSVAMASGSDIASQAANIVLLDSDFSSMPEVVMEGRRVINNIERSASLYLTKNIFSFALTLLTLFFALPYPLEPSQLSLISALTIGIPSFFLALEPNESIVRGHFLKNVLSPLASRRDHKSDYERRNYPVLYRLRHTEGRNVDHLRRRHGHCGNDDAVLHLASL